VTEVRIIPLVGIPEIREGDDLATYLVDASREHKLTDEDIVVVAHKVVSKSEGRVTKSVDRQEVAISESSRILRKMNDLLISETRHGLVCANAGVDASNSPPGTLVLLPVDPDLSARRLRSRIRHLAGVEPGVVITDTFGRAWRLGQTNVAVGVAGLDPFVDYRGATDPYGNELRATQICVADELASAAELVMGKTRRVCAALVRGGALPRASGAATQIVRPIDEDLFR
jgi:coenzyme F420-0:L-glutamate ligase/coenzyme F420-1:gamma-L-glutamate ligase